MSQNIEAYIQSLWKERNGTKKSGIVLKKFEFFNRTDIPRQLNSYDCGVFVCKFAEYVIYNNNNPNIMWNFSQKDMERFRKELMLEIANFHV